MSENSVKVASPRELELKLGATVTELERLKSIEFNGSISRCSEPVTENLETVYFDTPDRLLRGSDLTFRVRKNGAAWKQTVKTDTRVRGGLSHPIEIECELPSSQPKPEAIPDVRVRKRLKKLVRKTTLHPVFKINVERTKRTLTTADGSIVEISLDQATAKAGRRKSVFGEVELELKAGRAAALVDVAEQIADAFPIRFSKSSKAERGFQLLDGAEEHAIGPMNLGASPISPKQNCGEAFQATLAADIGQVLHNWLVVDQSDDPEGPHQLRVGLRRLRAALDAFDTVAAGHEEIRSLQSDFRDLGRVISDLRDQDVLIGDIVQPISGAPEFDTGLEEASRVLSHTLTTTRQSVRQTLASSRWSRFKVKLALLGSGVESIESGIGGQLSRKKLAPNARKALARCWKKVERLGRRIDGLSVEGRHEMRKKLKALRYTLEIFAPLYAKRDCRRFIKDLKKLQDVFGYLNDATIARQLRQLDTANAADSRAMDQAIGYVIGFHDRSSEDMWSHAKTRWSKLQKAEKPWC